MKSETINIKENESMPQIGQVETATIKEIDALSDKIAHLRRVFKHYAKGIDDEFEKLSGRFYTFEGRSKYKMETLDTEIDKLKKANESLERAFQISLIFSLLSFIGMAGLILYTFIKVR